jgi:FkbM family methyltransferase
MTTASLKSRLRRWVPAPVLDTYRRARRAATSRGLRIVSCRVNGMELQLGITSEIEAWRAATYATKEPETLAWIDRHLRDGDTLFDVGANIGLYTLYAARRNPRAMVYAFEPESQNYAALCRNIVLNRLANVVPCNAPLSDREAFELFHVGQMESGASLHTLGGANPFRGADAVPLRQGAISTTLDAIVSRYGVPQPMLLKLDVDGTEEQILRGAGRVLADPRLRSVLSEWSVPDGQTGQPSDRLSQFGLRMIGVSGDAFTLNGVRAQNYIWERADAG